jgi:hypothetical protein
MEVDRVQKGIHFNLDNAVPVTPIITKKLSNILSAESTLMSVEMDNDKHFIAKMYLLANPIDYYKEMNKLIRKAYKIHGNLEKYRNYKVNSRVFNSINIIENNGAYYLEIQKKSAQGFIDILNSHELIEN